MGGSYARYDRTRSLLPCCLCKKSIAHRDDFVSFVPKKNRDPDPRKYAHLSCYNEWRDKKE